MLWRETLYSRIVSWLKIILPLAALAILSTLFLLSNGRDNLGAIPYTQPDLQERMREGMINTPQFAGASAHGDLISFSAQTAKPDPSNDRMARAEKLSARIDLVGGTILTFESDSAVLDTSEDTARLTGGVVVTTSTGYDLRTAALFTSMREIEAETEGNVRGTAPAGSVEAGKMVLSSDPETGDAHLLFTNRVKLVYQPKN